MFKEMILSIKHNSRRMFVAVEKGVGKHKNSAFLLINPAMRMVVREQIKENRNTVFKFDNIKEQRYSVKIGEFNGLNKYQTES